MAFLALAKVSLSSNCFLWGVGPCGSAWLLLAPSCSWLLMAAPGCLWLLLAAPGCSWLLLFVFKFFPSRAEGPLHVRGTGVGGSLLFNFDGADVGIHVCVCLLLFV